MNLPGVSNPKGLAVLLATGAVVLVGFLWLGKRELGKAASAVGGLVSGNNNITHGTPYEGTGLLGTAGAIANSASGGVFQEWGEAIGKWSFELFNKVEDPNNPRSPAAYARGVAGATPDPSFKQKVYL